MQLRGVSPSVTLNIGLRAARKDDVFSSANSRKATSKQHPFHSKNAVMLGDGTGRRNIHAEVTCWEFRQVPEPSGMALLSALVFAAFSRRKKK